MSNVISINFKKRKVDKTANYLAQSAPSNAPMAFMDEVQKDTENLSNATGISHEDAVKMASDFYQKYPMLVEHVRSIEYMTRNK